MSDSQRLTQWFFGMAYAAFSTSKAVRGRGRQRKSSGAHEVQVSTSGRYWVEDVSNG